MDYGCLFLALEERFNSHHLRHHSYFFPCLGLVDSIKALLWSLFLMNVVVYACNCFANALHFPSFSGRYHILGMHPSWNATFDGNWGELWGTAPSCFLKFTSIVLINSFIARRYILEMLPYLQLELAGMFQIEKLLHGSFSGVLSCMHCKMGSDYPFDYLMFSSFAESLMYFQIILEVWMKTW